MTRMEHMCERKSNTVLCPQLKNSRQVIDTTLNREHTVHTVTIQFIMMVPSGL